MTLTRIIIHWTAGAYTPNRLDRRHYHFIIDGQGNAVPGDHPPEANVRIASPNDGDTYAAHTRGTNTGAIGVAFAAMGGAKDWPFDHGKWPITPRQVDGMVRLVAHLCKKYGISVTPETVLTHAEVEPTLGIKQRGKWDVRWLPGMAVPGDPVAVGNILRKRVAEEARAAQPKKTATPEKTGWTEIITSIFAAVASLFRRPR